MKKIVVTGASTYGVKNMGDDAMLASMVQGFRRSLPGCEITFLARHPNTDYDKAFGFKSLKNLDHDTKEAATGRFFWGMNAGDSTQHLQDIAKAIQEADLLVLGGNSFMEIFPNSFLKGVSAYSATLGTLAKFMGTPFALFGLNVVADIKAETTQQHAKFLCENSVAVTLREESGLNFLNALGIEGDHLQICGDPAFGMQADTSISTQAILERGGIRLTGKPVIGIGFRHEYWGGDDALYAENARHFAAMLDRVGSALDAQFLFIPNCTYTQSNKWQDDRLVHRQIAEAMELKGRAHLIEEDLSVFETFALFSLVDLHISNRRHSCIFAAMQNVPFVALEGSLVGHMPPFVQDLGVPDQLSDVGDFAAIEGNIMSSWASRKEIVAKMKPNVVRLTAEARSHVPQILGALA